MHSEPLLKPILCAQLPWHPRSRLAGQLDLTQLSFASASLPINVCDLSALPESAWVQGLGKITSCLPGSSRFFTQFLHCVIEIAAIPVDR